ncbi:hypothetical protein [Streptomyces flavidovirens]|uniref:hypothetical protein n=1 Tax=Streptomyces flavidovirens TaxID=67298 RepID=UPI000408F9C3|nr:hypothetical protein [Streptomyces flavidovirens]
MDLESITDELYGLAPADFTAARNERAAAARTAGDRELAGRIQALRRPTLSAWASNLLVRRQPEQVQPLISLGEGMRRAHRDLDGEQLRELGRRQHDLVGALARQAKQLAADAGHPVSEDVQREVESTLHAVLADPDAAREWASGRLTKPLSPPVGFTAATTPTAVPPNSSRPARSNGPRLATSAAEAKKKEREEEKERARKEQRAARIARAEKDATTAEQQARDAEEELARAETRLREAENEVTALAEQLKEAKERQKADRGAVATARDRAREAGAAAREARRRAEDAAAHADGR